MARSSAERQKAYRKRQKRTRFYESSYLYQRLMELSAEAGKQSALQDALDYCYDLGGEDLVERMGLLVCESLAVIVRLQSVRVGVESPGLGEMPQ